MVPIAKSPLADYFDDVPPDVTAEVMWLERDEAAAVWRDWGDDRAKNIYDLPEGHWIARGTWLRIGRWMEAYNGKEPAAVVPAAIARATRWQPDDRIVIVQSATKMANLPMKVFPRCWGALIAAFDDGPLVVPATGTIGAVVRLVPLGDILFGQRGSGA